MQQKLVIDPTVLDKCRFDLVPALKPILDACGQPQAVAVAGQFCWGVLVELQSTLAALAQDALIALILRSDYLEGTEHPRLDYKVIIDKASRLLAHRDNIWIGRIPICAFDFQCIFSVFPDKRSIHLHDVSLERLGAGNIGGVRGKGIFSQFFANLAQLFAEKLSGFSVSAVAIEDAVYGAGKGVIPHLMVKEFGAQRCVSEGMCVPGNGVYVDPFDRASIYIGRAGTAA